MLPRNKMPRKITLPSFMSFLNYSRNSSVLLVTRVHPTREYNSLPMRCLLIVATLLGSLTACAQDWRPLEFLVGHWTGEGTTADQGSGTGAFSFTPDLQNKILLRKNFAEYPKANGKSAYRHDDLMI